MAENIIVVYCPHCNTPYEVPQEYIGQTAECGTCNKSFEIAIAPSADAETAEPLAQGTVPTHIEEPEAETEDSDDQEEEGTTSTVKLSRSSIGMVPEVEDNFKLDIVNKISQHEEQPQESSVKATAKNMTASSSFRTKFASQQAQSTQSAQQPPADEQNKAHFWKFWGKK